MRMAEESYGWDALHPRLAAQRDRKARIAAAAAALEKTESGRETGDEMSVDESGDDNSDVEMGGAGTSGPEAVAEPVKEKKKRRFKEDEYDRDDGFVDDSEMLWEEQAAASRDGFFVYSGPLVQEAEKPATQYVCPFAVYMFFANPTPDAMPCPSAVAGAEAAGEAVAAAVRRRAARGAPGSPAPPGGDAAAAPARGEALCVSRARPRASGRNSRPSANGSASGWRMPRVPTADTACCSPLRRPLLRA